VGGFEGDVGVSGDARAHAGHGDTNKTPSDSSVCDTTYRGVIQTRTLRNREDTHACDVAT